LSKIILHNLWTISTHDKRYVLCDRNKTLPLNLSVIPRNLFFEPHRVGSIEFYTETQNGWTDICKNTNIYRNKSLSQKE